MAYRDIIRHVPISEYIVMLYIHDIVFTQVEVKTAAFSALKGVSGVSNRYSLPSSLVCIHTMYVCHACSLVLLVGHHIQIAATTAPHQVGTPATCGDQ